MLVRSLYYIKHNFRSFLTISFIFGFSLISYSIFSFEFEESNSLFLKKIHQNSKYYIIESYFDLSPYYVQISSLKTINSFLPYSYFYENDIMVNAMDFELLDKNKIKIVCGNINKDFDNKKYVIAGINFNKTNKENPCDLINSYLSIRGERFKVVGLFKMTKNSFFDLRDDSIIISFRNYSLKNINNSAFYSFVSEVNYSMVNNFKKEILEILPTIDINTPKCSLSLREIKAKRDFFLFLKNKNFYFMLISSFVLGLMSAYINRKFFLLLRIIGCNINELILIVFIYSFLICFFLFPIYYISVYLLNYLLKLNLMFNILMILTTCMIFFLSHSLVSLIIFRYSDLTSYHNN